MITGSANSLIYGLAAGVFLMAGMAVGFVLGGDGGSGGYGSELFGYSLTLLAAAILRKSEVLPAAAAAD